MQAEICRRKGLCCLLEPVRKLGSWCKMSARLGRVRKPKDFVLSPNELRVWSKTMIRSGRLIIGLAAWGERGVEGTVGGRRPAETAECHHGPGGRG